ncbi:hypothetical protein [Nonomuraea longicatena]|uniref:Thioredoxin domain-containing protein n=1 Tax=Nonomuraea longicatena TaxID=83682 RepID=A0ABN1PYS0_9ACTN
MSLPLALTLLSLLISLFTLVAVGAVYSRLRVLEQTALNPAAVRLADEQKTVVPELRPQDGEVASVVLLMDSTCAICHQAWAMLHETSWPGLRIIGLVAEAHMASAFSGGPVHADADQWAELYEGYAPCLYAVAPSGTVIARRFVYGDTDLPELLTTLLSSRSSHAL